MRDIPGEAILFDMYYAAKDPIPLDGEKRELPKVEFKPVDETTPVFKNFYINNVFVAGAEKAIFMRGLPEMHVKDIVLENMLLQTNKGMDIQETSGVTFRNIKIFCKETSKWYDDYIGYSIRCNYPANIFDADTKTTAHIAKCYIDNRSVNQLHNGG